MTQLNVSTEAGDDGRLPNLPPDPPRAPDGSGLPHEEPETLPGPDNPEPSPAQEIAKLMLALSRVGNGLRGNNGFPIEIGKLDA